MSLMDRRQYEAIKRIALGAGAWVKGLWNRLISWLA